MDLLRKFFKIAESGSSVKVELIAGTTTFFTMAYIIFVQPAVLSAAGMDFGAVMTATCLSAAFASIMMGLYANHPIALAPVMGENFFFAFTLILAMNVKWETALGIVFFSGVIFLLMSLFNLREILINAIPASLKSGITVGIGLFIAFIGLVYAGVVQKSKGGMLELGPLDHSHIIVTFVGLLVIGALIRYKVRGAIMIGMVVSALVAFPFGIVKFQGVASMPPSISPTFAKMDLTSALTLQNIPLILIFLFMLIFDTVGTVVGVTEQAGLVDKDGGIPRIKKIPFTYSIADGLAFGFISYPILKIFTGKIKQINWIMILLGLIFILRYVFISF